MTGTPRPSPMSSTLDALHRAVVANPTDRTVRLVYADALDEIAEPHQVARAEFIRAQLELESASLGDEQRALLTARVKGLFEEHWLRWWAPVAEAARLPYPHIPGKRIRDGLTRTGRRPRRTRNWPYSHNSDDTSIELVNYGLTFPFVGGFPEAAIFRSFETPEGGPVLLHQWGDAIPLSRLSFTFFLSLAQWERVNGPHLSRLTDLSLDAMLPDVAHSLASSPHLESLTRLSVNVHGSDADAIRALVSQPPWEGLRQLVLSGRLTAPAVRQLAHACRLKHLTELELTLGNPGFLPSPYLDLCSF